MRILYCNKYNFTFSGTEAYLFETMELMRARGHEVALFSMADERGPRTAHDRHFVPHADFKRTGSALSRAALGLRAIYSVDARRKIRALIEEFRPDVAHVRNIYHHLTPSILWELKGQGIPVLYHVNDFKVLCPSYNMVGASGDACERCRGGRFHNVIREGCYSGGRAASVVLAAEAYLHKWISTYQECVDLLLAPSEFVKQKFVENGWAAERIRVLPHFQKLPIVTNAHPGQPAPILYFGRLSREKGVADLLAAMQQLPQIKLVIAGDGPERASLQRLGDALKPGNVTFTGHLSGPAIDDLISASQFSVFPSHAYETFGKSIVESYAQARAVVASDLGSRRELVEHGKTGLLYPVKDVKAFADRISFLYDNPSVSQRLGEAGRELVRNRHSQRGHLETLEGIYEELKSNKTESGRRSRTPADIHLPRVANIGGRGIGNKYSGIESYYEETGKRLAQMGYEVIIYCRAYFTPCNAESHGMKIMRLPALRTKHLETFTHTLLSTFHASFSECDIVHYHCLGPALFSWIPRLFGKKTVVTVQGLDWQRNKWRWLARKVLKFGEWASAKCPNETIVVSDVLRRRYKDRFSEVTTLVRNGTEARSRTTGDYLSSVGLQPDTYVLYLGRFSPEKNCHLLIEAFTNTQCDFKLVLAGGSSHTDEYAARLQQQSDDRITFLDWLSGSALDQLLTNAALFVLPSEIEGSSLAMLDAMAAGICVLASDIPENLETMQNAGFSFQRRNIHDLERMLAFLLANPQIRKAAGRYAQETARRSNSWDEVTQQLSNVYRELAGVSKSEHETVPRLKAAA